MLLGTLSMALSIVVLNVHFSHENENVPKWVEVFILNGLAKVLLMRTYRGSSVRGSSETLEDDFADFDSIDSAETNGASPNNDGICDGVLHSQDYSIDCSHKNKESALEYLRKKAKRLKCLSCRSNRRRRRRRGKTLPYEWAEVTRVMDRLFFVIVFILMTLSTFLTLYAPHLWGPTPEYTL